MDNLHLSVVAVVLYCHLPGSVGTKSQQILLDTHHHSDCQWGEELFLNCSFTGMSTVPEDISETAVTADFSYNNIKTFLCTDGRNKEWMLKHLNLSNNLISELFLTTCRNLPALETLILDGNAIHTLTLDIPTPAYGSYGKADDLLPALKVLSMERNHLNTVPRGLGLLQSLQTVHMSSNGIQQIDLNDFQNCSQLKDIDLQNNHITNIHPDAFRELNKLQVVDLRGNALTTPLPQILINLNFFRIEVDLPNNAWMFNCRLNAFKHFIHFLFDPIRKKMSILYNKSGTSSQKPLLYLSSLHLNCSDSVLLKGAAIPTGKTLVLNCNLDNTRGNKNGASWWTPNGRIPKDTSLSHMTLDKMNNLVIHNAEKAAEGLYLCISNTTKKKYLIYDIQVKERGSTFLVRKARDANLALRQGRTEQDLTLAVCLSVLITFVCAFCLGAFARPYLGSLWRLICRNKNSVSEHTYCNQAFSDETLSRECSANTSKTTNTQHSLFICDEDSSRNVYVLPAETSTSQANVIGSSICAPNTEEEYQKQINDETNVKKKAFFPDIKTSISNDENVNVDENGLFSVRINDKDSKEVTPRKLKSNEISLQKDPIYANNEASEKSRITPIRRRSNADSYSHHTDSSDSDLPFKGESGFPLSTIQAHTVAQDSRNSKVSNSSALLQSDITKATPNCPERSVVSQNEAMSTTKCMPERQSCDKQLCLSSNINLTSDVGDFVLPSSCRRNTNIENYNCKAESTNERGALADIFDDSSSDEGAPFTMSDCSSLADFELDQDDVRDNLPVCQSSVEEADRNSGNKKCSTLPESANLATGLQCVGENEDKNNAHFESAINYGSDTIMLESALPYADKCSSHVSMSDPDTITSANQDVPVTFDHFINAKAAAQTSVSDSLCNPSAGFGNMLLSFKHSPMYDADTESTPKEAELQPDQFPTKPQHSLSFSPTGQKANAPEGSTDEHRDRKSSEKNHGEGGIALRNTSEDTDFIFAPIDTGLNEIVKRTSVLHSSNNSPPHSLPEHTAENQLTVITETEDLLPQRKQVNTPTARADVMQRGFNEKNCDGYMELQDTSHCSLPEAADLLHLHSSGKTQPIFDTDHFQLDQSDKDAHSLSVPQGFFSESTQYSSCSFPQTTTGNTISKSTDFRKVEDDTTLTGLQNSSTAAVNFQNSSEKLHQRGQTNLGQGQVFVKKKRAFDGFAKVLESRRTNFNS
ncbi:leucine-rich repeat-containing protein 66 [Melopsittacus undulatus]|uniref:leucine-rich repeat-containing protein 66 n=1 Tax=Melopsittacus undulatus TaxID=13146 RepID=UPI00146CD6D3|nr:leucine-rich repeat-containing protein 66 [Melopsittacus undulatus]